MVQDLFWKVGSFFAGQEIALFLWNPNVPYCVQSTPSHPQPIYLRSILTFTIHWHIHQDGLPCDKAFCVPSILFVCMLPISLFHLEYFPHLVSPTCPLSPQLLYNQHHFWSCHGNLVVYTTVSIISQTFLVVF